MISPASVFRIRPSIILFGDSITQQAFGVDGGIGWASLLASSYSRRADVLNRGFSGYNTQLAVDRLLSRVFTGPMAIAVTESKTTSTITTRSNKDNTNLEVLPPSEALFCTVFFGANDASLPGGVQHVPPAVFEANLVTIVKHIQATLGNPPIVLLTPPPFDAPAWMAFRQVSEPGRDNTVAKSYGDRVKRVAEHHDLALVDTWALLQGDSKDKSKYLSDGLHLNEQGNRLVYKGIMKALKARYPYVLPMEDGDGKYGSSGVALEEELWEKALNKIN